MKKKTLLLTAVTVVLGAAAAMAFVSRPAKVSETVSPVRGVSSTKLIEEDLALRKPVEIKTAAATSPVPVSAPEIAAARPASVSENTPVETPAFVSMLSKDTDARSTVYVVKPGDNLTAISKKRNVTIGLIKRINGLKSDVLQPDMKLKLPTYKFSVVVDKSLNTLVLKGDEDVLKTYTISTGAGNRTPVGVFKLTDKVSEPAWYKDGRKIAYGDPENVLGTRWMGLSEKGYGIHGTTEPDKLGQQVTEGCVRMRNEEVEELYVYLPYQTEVTIVD